MTERWIAVAGDVHGAFDALGALLERFQRATGHAIDLVLQVGDLEPHRGESDLETLIAPEGGRRVGDFPRYASGESRLPAEVVFIGGNHEPWGFLESVKAPAEVSPGFTFLGRAGIVERLGLQIAGLSGIHHPRWSERPREPGSAPSWERATYFSRDDVAAVLAFPRVDVLLLHDWPEGVLEDRDRPRLPGLVRGEVVGNAPARLVVDQLRPAWVFCGHRHVAYSRDLEVDTATVRVRCLADVTAGAASAVTFLRVNDTREVSEVASLEELEALSFATGDRRRSTRRRA